MTYAKSGKESDRVTLDAVRQGDVDIEDVRIHPDTLARQADVARAHANPQLAENLLRAAELALLPDDQVMSIYEALRPRRSTFEELAAIADALDGHAAPRNAALVREAAHVYRARNLLR